MYKRILVAIDHSEQRWKVVAAAGEIAVKFGAEVEVVHAQELMAWHEVAALWPPPPNVRELMAQRHIKLLKEATRELARLQIQASYDLLLGGDSVAGRILAKAEQTKADLIVMGARGTTELVGLLLGSVSHKITQLAQCNVLVVR
jgi:nucleotide-binding universal stress UspA family protein